MNGTIGMPRFVSKETERKWVLNAIEEHETGKAIRLAICLNENDQHIGYIYLESIDHQNKSCNIGILIGEYKYHKQGLASEARYLLLKYAFLELGLNRVTARILNINFNSKRSFGTVGFIYEGALRKSIFRNGEFHDVLLFSMLRDEFLDKYNLK
jgi:RimJ/RimL family protein N-acetyltransferase